MNDNQQLLPGFSVGDDTDFDSFWTTSASRLARATLKQLIEQSAGDFVYLSGSTGSGKSHLLQASCNLANASGSYAMYMPLREFAEYEPQTVVEGLDDVDLLCFDDVDAIADKREWQVALFDIFNRRLHEDKALYFAAEMPAREIDFQLADLKSRLESCLSFQLPVLNDEEKIQLLQFRCDRRGIELNDSCCQYIIQRSGRGSHDLMAVIEKLDQGSLVAGRKITVPFIKNLMGW